MLLPNCELTKVIPSACLITRMLPVPRALFSTVSSYTMPSIILSHPSATTTLARLSTLVNSAE